MMRSIPLAALLLAAAALGAVAASAAGAELAPAALESRAFTLEQGQTRIELGRSFIVAGSDSVTLDGRPLERGDEYRINVLRGTIVLVRAAAGGELVIVRFSRHPLPFPPLFAVRVAESVPGEAPLEPMIEARRPEQPRSAGESYQLRFSGSKSVGVSVGSNRDLGLDQSLKVTVAGKVAKDLEVNAYLTDDDLPIQPEGNTEELKQLDRVFVQVKSKRSDVRLGDFQSAYSAFRFSSFKRELRGVAADVSAGGHAIAAAGGIAKGRFRTARLTGREGVQGPYELLPAQRFNSVTILAGTEIVYFNGRILRRGAENEYVIDYNRGAVTFTERLPVTDDSEIVVDYEEGESGYERSTLSAAWASPEWKNSVRLRMSLFQEGDDETSPVAGALSDADRAVLAAAGDDPTAALTSGIEAVEPGTGDYVLVPAGEDPEHFVFVESGGDYRLSFIDVGSGEGDYRTDGFSTRGYVKYLWVGEGNGSFRIGRSLPLPERRRIFSIGTSAGRGALYLDAEGSVSSQDRNLLSNVDDDDNGGSAGWIEGGLRDYRLPGAALTFSGEYSEVEARYAAPDKLRESYFYRDWGLEDVELTGSERIAGARLGLAGERPWTIAGTAQRLSRSEGLSAEKLDGTASVGDPGNRGLAVRGMSSDAGSGRERRFLGGNVSWAFWRLVPRLALEGERYESRGTASPDTGRFYRQGAFSLAGREIGPYRAALSLTRRSTDLLDTLDGIWREGRLDDEASFDAGYAAGNRIVELLATYRRSNDRSTLETDRHSLARVRARDAWERSGLAADISYRISGGEERTLQRSVVYVGENQGDYDALGREVGQKRGDYMLVFIPGAARLPVRAVEFGMQISFGSGVRGIGGAAAAEGLWGRIKREVSLDHSFSVIEKSITDDLARLYLLDPSLLQRNDVTVYGVTRLREELGLFNASNALKLRVIYSREDEEDNRTAGSPAESFAREVRVRAESAPWTAIALTWEARSAVARRGVAAGIGQSYEVETIAGSQTLLYRFNPSTRLSVEIGAESRFDVVSAARQTSYLATPSLNSSIGPRFNVSALLRLTWTDAQTTGGKPLFFLEEGLREDWNAIGQYRVSRNISFGLNYTGRREKNYAGEVSTVHDLKMESRAYF